MGCIVDAGRMNDTFCLDGRYILDGSHMPEQEKRGERISRIITHNLSMDTMNRIAMGDNCVVYDLDIPQGWVAIIEWLYWHLEEIPNDTRPTVLQIKEKFGGLRFYTSHSHHKFDAYIDFAEKWAFQTCEVCGCRGQTRNIEGRQHTLCPPHYHGTIEGNDLNRISGDDDPLVNELDMPF
ncbi:hypothetical protein WCLP8_3020003 [uncultured Gammaproteobacteria bacterium]